MEALSESIHTHLKGTVVCTLRFSIDAFHRIEKIFWIAICIIGTLIVSYVIKNQIQSWQYNAVVSNVAYVPLGQVDVPAVTLCHRGNSKYAVAERFGNAITNPSKFGRLRKTMIQKVALSNYDVSYHDFSYSYESKCKENHVEFYCKDINEIKQYSQLHNLTVEDILLDVYNDIENQGCSMPPLKLQKIHQFQNESGIYQEVISHSEYQNLLYLAALQKFFIEDKADFCPSDLGTFYVHALSHERILQEVFNQSDFDAFFNLFQYHHSEAASESNMSLITLGHLYTMNDFGQLVNELFTFEMKKPYLGGLQDDHKQCFLAMADQYYGNSDNDDHHEQDSEQEIVYRPPFDQASPCLENVTQNHPCHSYCLWHKNFILKQFPKIEFMTLMKLALPQGKMYMGDLKGTEKKMIQKVFGNDVNFKDFMNPTSPNPFVIFCKNRRDQRWISSEIGRYCGDFYASPTDVGLCMTQNQNLDDIVQLNPDFIDVFDQNENGGKMKKVTGGTFWGQATLVIDTQSKRQTSPLGLRTKPNKNDYTNDHWIDLGKIQLQLHHPRELANILHGAHQEKKESSIKLIAGHEYTISIQPISQNITERFKDLPLEIRGCRLPHELPENSFMKVYNGADCRYECKVKISMEKCKCIPWEYPYPALENTPECDIFGRTCFHNSIDVLAHNIENDCPECLPICEYTVYHKEIKEDKKLVNTDQSSNTYYHPTDYFNIFHNECHGNTGICNYLLENDTYFDHTWYNYTKSFGVGFGVKDVAVERFADLIIVHLEYVSPKVPSQILDARMSIYDCIAALGGTFGILTQLTGCSLITLLHLLILVCKGIFNHFRD